MRLWKTFYLKDNVGVACFKRWWSRKITTYIVIGTKEDILNKFFRINYVDNGLIVYGKKQLFALLDDLMKIKQEPFNLYWTQRYGFMPSAENLYEERAFMMREIEHNKKHGDLSALHDLEQILQDISKDMKIRAMIDAYLIGDGTDVIIKRDFNVSADLVNYYLSKRDTYVRR